jgi:hypothetical protein
MATDSVAEGKTSEASVGVLNPRRIKNPGVSPGVLYLFDFHARSW